VTKSILDDAGAIQRLDPGGMLESVRSLPEQCRVAWDMARGLKLPGTYRSIDRIVIFGMGGSAISGDFFRAILGRECAVPVFNVRAYDMPPYVDERTLVIASSFSGDTEEVLSAFGQSLAVPSPKIVITTGGQLLTTARANGIPAFTFEHQGEPRSAMGWGLMPLLAIAEELRLTHDVGRDVEEAVELMTRMLGEIDQHVPAAENAAKQMATALHEKLPVVYGAGPLIEVARRWKTQLNESGKTAAYFEELPELHHNAIIGYALPKRIAKETAVIFLESETLVHHRVQLRYGYTKEVLKKAGTATLEANARGNSALAQMMGLVLLGDFISTYLAFLYGVDPTPTTPIDDLKAWLKTQR
jgi:glucose/mannose-6-phosphate isomerase